MRVADFDFDLPEVLIALRPARPRDRARLLVVEGARLTDATVRDLPGVLRAGDLLVLNDTRVIPARLEARRASRGEGHPPARVELLLHHREGPARWRAFARPAKRLKAGDALDFAGALGAEVVARGAEGEVTLTFDKAGAALDAAIAALGQVPLPPYIASHRPADAEDATDYQTVYARAPGAVAAPTAGLHFTPALFDALEAHGVRRVTLTLHVGAGTFLPVKAEDTEAHVMHEERGQLAAAAADAINATRAAGGRIVAVGTTSLRLLESAAHGRDEVRPFDGTTRIFLTPGHRFRAADLLLTNFHLPRSTLVMLVQAFGGVDALRRAYAHAIAARYRFYSYGDACLIERAA